MYPRVFAVRMARGRLHAILSIAAALTGSALFWNLVSAPRLIFLGCLLAVPASLYVAEHQLSAELKRT